MRIYVILCITFSLLAGELSCDSSVSEAVEILASEGNSFALDVYNELKEKVENDNIFFSPVSISLALAMTYAGARGNTKEQMADVLGFTGDFENDSDLYPVVGEFIERLRSPMRNYTLNIANRLFGHQDYVFLPEFLEITASHFDATLEKLDFVGKPDVSRTHINDWVEEQTNGMIEDFLAQGTITSETALVLVNAIYFKGLWSVPFDSDDTEALPFYSTDTDATDVDMMSVYDYFNYAEDSVLACKILELPYGSGDASMIILLPNERTGLEQLEEDFEEQDLDRIFSSVTEHKIDVLLPKFKLTQDIALKALLAEMGMRDLFDAQRADLSGISGARNLVVTEVMHKAFLDVNEEGTEAAAATGVISVVTSVLEKTYFHADHPFMFLIVEKAANSILFMGRLTNPEETGSPIGMFGQSYEINSGTTPHLQITMFFTGITLLLSLLLSTNQ